MNATNTPTPRIEDLIARSQMEEDSFAAKIYAVDLPPELTEFARRYEEMGGERDVFLWKWCWDLQYARKPGFMLSSVPEKYRRNAALAKSLLGMAATFIDDVSDTLKDRHLLDAILTIPLDGEGAIPDDLSEKGYLRAVLVRDTLSTAHDVLAAGPRWDEFRTALYYDLKQTWNSFAYAYLVNTHPELMNITESRIYTSHTMMFYIFADIDAVFSPSLDIEEAPKLREAIWHAQQMSRIGNCVSTWKREVRDEDVTSGVVGYGMSTGIIRPADLKAIGREEKKREVIARLTEKRVEENLFQDWEQNRARVLEIGKLIHSVDIGAYLEGIELVMFYYLSSRGKGSAI
ncbi:hypothetical protein [uncultured Methanofollis sp.]|uniref:hypothetical protein n=1 Tax=uncultured Methanofollis sp. TaxID=262500 RepID=UPI0026275F76|nr:hypothetical protein [uncultured Methanofollis sp.]